MTIGERIKARRLELGLTQTELANRLGLKSKVSISTVENDKEDLTTDRIKKFADALETTPASLMGWNPNENYHLDKPIVIKPNNPNFKVRFTKDGEEETIQAINVPETASLYTTIMVLSAMLKDRSVHNLLSAAHGCTKEQIQVAIDMLNTFKKKE